ncbi:MAG TPA: hypothetical protein VHA74_01805 [Candidatus Dojkabacteria bacterium]|nr:hypothetical protein [Candidatus Dojkabacteria bacterium]
MTYSEAYKYSEVLEIMANPYALMIMDFMYEHDGYHAIDELVKITGTSESKIRDLMYKLEHKSIVDKDFVDDVDKYQIQQGSFSYFIERLISIID